MADEYFPEDFELSEGVFYYCAGCAEVLKPIVIKNRNFLFPDLCAYCAKPFNLKQLKKDGIFRIPVENADLFVRRKVLQEFSTSLSAFCSKRCRSLCYGNSMGASMSARYYVPLKPSANDQSKSRASHAKGDMYSNASVVSQPSAFTSFTIADPDHSDFGDVRLSIDSIGSNYPFTADDMSQTSIHGPDCVLAEDLDSIRSFEDMIPAVATKASAKPPSIQIMRKLQMEIFQDDIVESARHNVAPIDVESAAPPVDFEEGKENVSPNMTAAATVRESLQYLHQKKPHQRKKCADEPRSHAPPADLVTREEMTMDEIPQLQHEPAPAIQFETAAAPSDMTATAATAEAQIEAVDQRDKLQVVQEECITSTPHASVLPSGLPLEAIVEEAHAHQPSPPLTNADGKTSPPSASTNPQAHEESTTRKLLSVPVSDDIQEETVAETDLVAEVELSVGDQAEDIAEALPILTCPELDQGLALPKAEQLTDKTSHEPESGDNKFDVRADEAHCTQTVDDTPLEKPTRDAPPATSAELPVEADGSAENNSERSIADIRTNHDHANELPATDTAYHVPETHDEPTAACAGAAVTEPVQEQAANMLEHSANAEEGPFTGQHVVIEPEVEEGNPASKSNDEGKQCVSVQDNLELDEVQRCTDDKVVVTGELEQSVEPQEHIDCELGAQAIDEQEQAMSINIDSQAQNSPEQSVPNVVHSSSAFDFADPIEIPSADATPHVASRSAAEGFAHELHKDASAENHTEILDKVRNLLQVVEEVLRPSESTAPSAAALHEMSSLDALATAANRAQLDQLSAVLSAAKDTDVELQQISDEILAHGKQDPVLGAALALGQPKAETPVPSDEALDSTSAAQPTNEELDDCHFAQSTPASELNVGPQVQLQQSSSGHTTANERPGGFPVASTIDDCSAAAIASTFQLGSATGRRQRSPSPIESELPNTAVQQDIEADCELLPIFESTSSLVEADVAQDPVERVNTTEQMFVDAVHEKYLHPTTIALSEEAATDITTPVKLPSSLMDYFGAQTEIFSSESRFEASSPILPVTSSLTANLHQELHRTTLAPTTRSKATQRLKERAIVDTALPQQHPPPHKAEKQNTLEPPPQPATEIPQQRDPTPPALVPQTPSHIHEQPEQSPPPPPPPRQQSKRTRGRSHQKRESRAPILAKITAMIDKLEPIRKSEVRLPYVAPAGPAVASTETRPEAPTLEHPEPAVSAPIETDTCGEVTKQLSEPSEQSCIQQQGDDVQSQSRTLLESDVEGKCNEQSISDDSKVDERCARSPATDTNASNRLALLEQIPAADCAQHEVPPNMFAEGEVTIAEPTQQQMLQQTLPERNSSETMTNGTEPPKPQRRKHRSHHRAERKLTTQRWVLVLGSLVALLAVVCAALSLSFNLYDEAHLDTHTSWVVDTYGTGTMEAGSVLRFCGFGTSIDVTAGGCEAMFLWVQTDGQVKVYRGNSPSTSAGVVWRHRKKFGRPLSGDNFVDYSFEKGMLEISREGTVLATFRAQQL